MSAADITAFHPARAVERYDDTAGDIFTQVNTGTPGWTVIAQPLTTTEADRGRRAGVSVMTLTLHNATAIIDHHHTQRPATQRYTRTWHHASQLNPGDLWRPDPDRAPHTVTEVHRTRVWNGPDQITLVDQYAHPYRYRSNEPVPTAIPDPLTTHIRCAREETTR